MKEVIRLAGRKTLLAFGLLCGIAAAAFSQAEQKGQALGGISVSESNELMEQLKNMPFIEVGKGVSFQARNKTFGMTMRARMQSLLEFDLDEDFHHTMTDAEVKRIRLNFEGYVLSPKLLYSIQLGFAPNDMKSAPNGNSNIVRNAILYYKPNSHWNFGVGQAKIKVNRAHSTSSSALEFVDRSIVDGQFQLDRDFGFFGEFYHTVAGSLDVAAKASITMGEGRNWGKSSSQSGFAYTGRLELFPFGSFKGKGEALEGDYEHEEQPKLMLGGAFAYNDNTTRLHGQTGDFLPDGETRSLKSYFADLVFKYRGFAFAADFMGRACTNPLFATAPETAVFAGKGVNVQASYMLPKHWSLALRNATLFPDEEIRPVVGYKQFHQTTLGITKYLMGHNFKVQADASYNHRTEALAGYDRWQFRFVLEVGI